MPCYDGREHEDDEDTKHMAEGGAHFCKLITRMIAGETEPFTQEMRDWWVKHTERDNDRNSRT